ncbi:MAG TPA: hypothetical protein VEA44_11820 [Caulobacter sp.]|nr:hypothetical protein [Caulobacter sp.]
MPLIALGIFVLAALGGLILASFVLRGRLAPWILSLGHAALGAAGLGILGYAALQGDASQMARFALIILVITALGGFFLASFHLRGKIGPKAVVAVHAAAAVTGVATLAAAVFNVF